jgi:hypothetical protein
MTINIELVEEVISSINDVLTMSPNIKNVLLLLLGQLRHLLVKILNQSQ